MTGASFFAGLIDQNGGNVLKAVAKYNGWFDGITIVSIINQLTRVNYSRHTFRAKLLLLRTRLAASARTTWTSKLYLTSVCVQILSFRALAP